MPSPTATASSVSWGRRHGHRLPGPGPEARPPGGGEGAPARTRRGDRRRAVPVGNQDHRQPPAPAHPAAVRQRRSRRLPLLRDAVRRGGNGARPDEPGKAAPGGGRGPDRVRGSQRARLRPPAQRDPPRHQAREHPAARRPRAGGRLRHRARGQQGRRHSDDRNRHEPRHAALHEPRTGDGRTGNHRALATSMRWAACSTRC